MNFKLARELEENGFPKKGCNWDYSHEHDKGQFVYFPNLSELIEACGDDILGLNRTHDDSGEPNGWVADTHTCSCDCGKDNCLNFKWEHESGATPTEAVARLWLAIKTNTPTV